MSQALIARQPIFDAHMRVYGYEVLFRASPESEQAELTDGDQATSSVLIDLFTNMDVDHLLGGKWAFINATAVTLQQLAAHPVAEHRMVVEVLEDVRVDDRVAEALLVLRQAGVRVALDDFLWDTDHQSLATLADFIKVDVQALSDAELERHARELAPFSAQLLAEKVETAEEWARCRELGFELFQGYFFARPQTFSKRRLPTDRVQILRLVARLQDPEVDLEELAALVEKDASLSYRLLRLINSAYFPTRNRVDDIRRATVYLGIEGLRTWVTWLALSRIDYKPTELKLITLERAQMARRLASPFGVAPESAFLVGLFSTLDALMDRPMKQLLADLPLSEGVKAALIDREGELGKLITALFQYEQGEWSALARAGCDVERMGQAYLEALEWAEGINYSL
ncbi:EAL and HDOD domain-containing protein [Thiohalorhabdus sp.]|uniref:EAL and HDOD domain-containing protein n=1 Tax=Thiohalorhabdus sp. TaxID=3094134 RepID=UPI002FC33D25